MSRELKFRAWDKKRKRYAKVIQTTNQGWKGYRDKTYITNGIMRFSKWVLSRFIIEQYTGLKDKNGKEIYEGDILRLYGRFVSAITWQDDFCGFRWHDNSGDGYCGLSKDNEEYYEAIGNIHENPELLGGEE